MSQPDAAWLAHPAATPGRLSAPSRAPVARTPFIAVVLVLLAGGLVCLLVVNTTLAAASFRIGDLQRGNAQRSQQVQHLQQQVAIEESPASIEHRAYRLGMRSQQVLDFVNLRTGRSYTTPAAVPGVTAVPGYTP